jgi:hypothetical protein
MFLVIKEIKVKHYPKFTFSGRFLGSSFIEWESHALLPNALGEPEVI